MDTNKSLNNQIISFKTEMKDLLDWKREYQNAKSVTPVSSDQISTTVPATISGDIIPISSHVNEIPIHTASASSDNLIIQENVPPPADIVELPKIPHKTNKPISFAKQLKRYL